MHEEVLPLRAEGQTAVPHVWRPALTAIVDSLIRGDDRIGQGVDNVVPLSEHDSDLCRELIAAYGPVTLVSLPDETWDTSIASWWHDNRWDCVVDLHTAEEGRSDLVLEAKVFHDGDASFRIHPQLVHVP
ncbi:hypothetical protein ACI2LF_31025 [Kribbella sp. NPDC020789]